MNIFKRSVSLLLALVLVLSLGTTAYAVSSPRMELEVSSQSIEATKTVEVTIKAYDIPKVFIMGFELHANNRIFETVSIDTNWSVSDQLAEKGYIRIAAFDATGDNLVVPEVIATVTLRATEDVEAADIWIEMQEASYMNETMVDIAAPEKISIEVTPHTHSYTETVVAPTCTEKGYTLSTCTCGDSEKSKYTDALGHNYENNECTVCGAPGTVIPEGAQFTDMLTDKGEIVTVTEKDGYYLVEVPYGTTSLLVTYPKELPKVDEFGYVSARMIGIDGVTDDAYGKTTTEENVIVGLVLEKPAASGAPVTIRLINLDNQYSKRVALVMADGSTETFALTYKLGNGQHFAVLPIPESCIGYTVTGKPIASDGYSFNVSILEGYEATENFAVKVNGKTVATEPGNVSIPSVTEDLKVTVEGVGIVQNNTTDVIFNVDLTAAPSGMTGMIMLQDDNYNFIEESLASGKSATAAITARNHQFSKVSVYSVNESMITGWEVNGTVYPAGDKQYVGDLVIWNRGYYFQVEYNGTTPITVNVKPVLVEAPDGKYHVFHTAADEYTITGDAYAGNGYTFNVAISEGYRATSDFAVKVNGKTVATVPGDITLDTVSDHIVITVEGIAALGVTITDKIPVIGDNISVRSIDIMKADVESYQWDGDTLNVVLAEGTAPNATIKTKWTMDVRNTNDGAEYCEFIFNDDYLYCDGSAGTFEETMDVTLADGTATATAAFTMCDCEDPAWDITFTPKTYTVNFSIAGSEPEQPASNPITEIEISHPSIVTDETTGAMSMAMVTGASEQINVSTVLENAELDATQVVVWSSSVPEVASVENGKVTALKEGSTVITAKAVEASGIALLADGEDVLAQFTLTVADPTDGYTVTMGEDVEAVVNNTVSVPVTIGHTGDVTKYNAFDLTFEYDPTVLELTSTKIDGMTVTVKDGKIHVERYGTDLTVGSTALTLTFKALTTGETNVKVTAAKVDISEAALTQDAPDASVIDNVTKVSVTGYTVSLPTEFKGESSVLPGENYTFEAKDKNYNYAFEGSTMNGQPVSIKDNGDGTFTIENVTGDIVILTQPTGKTFTVTLGEDMTSTATNAQYMTAYTATLTKADGYNYNVTVEIGGQKFTGFTYDASTGLITIPGEAITGEIVFNSNKTAKTPDKHSVEFTGEYGDIAEGTLLEVDNGTDYILTINKVLGYKYTITATMAGEPAEVIDNGDGTYTIENVTGDLVITIAKEYDLTVEVAEYVELNGKVMFLVTATATVDEGKVLSYNGTAMFWSNQYNAWSYLVITEGTLSVEDAKALITLNEGEKVELDQTYNVNESVSGTVDINDAQLVFDMYNNKYQDFINNATMQKFLKADVNGDKTINTSDAAAVVSEIVKNK